MRISVLTENTASRPDVTAEHGLSLLIEAGGHAVLFDMGQSEAFADNAQKMGVDLNRVDAAVLSHGHYDHGGGLGRFFRENDHAPVYMHAQAFEPHYSHERFIGLNPAWEQRERIVFAGEGTRLNDSMRLAGCNTRERRHAQRGEGMLAERDGRRIPDDFCHEQYLIVEEAGRRVVVSGCSHKGVLNVLEWLKPDVLIGGFHLMKTPARGEGREVLEETARALLSFQTRYYTCHCTGAEQYEALRAIMGDRLTYIRAGDVRVI